MKRGEAFLYLTTIGRKSGQPHEIEIWYVEHGAGFYLCAEGRERAHWVQNILAQPQVTFSVGTRDDPQALVPRSTAKARPLHAERDRSLYHIVTQLFQGKYGWSSGLLVEVMPLDDAIED
jgi:deazaflavin-dependent oxidoreductase (nitroreductase family)